MQEEKRHYQFIYTDDGRRLVCPSCSALLVSADVEMFPRCPYCNAPLERTPEFDDFTLDGLVRHWQRNCFGIGSGR